MFVHSLLNKWQVLLHRSCSLVPFYSWNRGTPAVVEVGIGVNIGTIYTSCSSSGWRWRKKVGAAAAALIGVVITLLNSPVFSLYTYYIATDDDSWTNCWNVWWIHKIFCLVNKKYEHYYYMNITNITKIHFFYFYPKCCHCPL